MNREEYMYLGILTVAILALFIFTSDIVVTIIAAGIAIGALTAMKKLEIRVAMLGFLLLLIIGFILMFYLSPSITVAQSQGTVLSENWFEALKWINENTKECAVVATYWDPGHFITGIGKRAVVFDGASQGSTLLVPNNDGIEGRELVLEEFENGAVQIKLYNDVGHEGEIRRARIKDIAITLFTDNETQAVEILRDYAKPDCEDEVYYIASSDLIGKSTWWSYFATWEPVNKGRATQMQILQLQQARPLAGQDAILSVYCCASVNGEALPIVIIDENGTLTPYLQVKNEFIKVSALFYFDDVGQGVLAPQEDGQLPGMVWLDPFRQSLIYIPEEIENSMFTRLFFFHGEGPNRLEHFEFVQNWGGEVKLFKVNF